MRTQSLSRALIAGSANAIALSQTPGGAGAMVLNGQNNNVCVSQTPGAGAGLLAINGVLSFAGAVILLSALPVSFVSAGNFSAASITVLGTNASGIQQTETITGPSGSTVSTSKSYKTIQAIQYTASPGGVAVTAYVQLPTLDVQRIVLFTPAADESTHTFTITGTDENGNTVTEVVQGANASPFSSTKDYKTVSSIVISAAATGAIQVGTSAVGSSKPIVVDQYTNPHNLRVQAALVSGTGNIDAQYTNDDLFDLTITPTWISISGLTNKAATTDDQSLIAPVTAVRLKTNSGTGTWRLTVKQPGIGGL